MYPDHFLWDTCNRQPGRQPEGNGHRPGPFAHLFATHCRLVSRLGLCYTTWPGVLCVALPVERVEPAFPAACMSKQDTAAGPGMPRE